MGLISTSLQLANLALGTYYVTRLIKDRNERRQQEQLPAAAQSSLPAGATLATDDQVYDFVKKTLGPDAVNKLKHYQEQVSNMVGAKVSAGSVWDLMYKQLQKIST